MKKLITSAAVLTSILGGLLTPSVAAAQTDDCPGGFTLIGHGKNTICFNDINGQGGGNTGLGFNIHKTK